MPYFSISLDEEWKNDLEQLKKRYKASSYSEIVRMGLNKLKQEGTAESC